jgi:di/tricarboxylate transporter
MSRYKIINNDCANQKTVLIVPIAIDVALGLSANPQTFALSTIIGDSTGFLTQVDH